MRSPSLLVVLLLSSFVLMPSIDAQAGRHGGFFHRVRSRFQCKMRRPTSCCCPTTSTSPPSETPPVLIPAEPAGDPPKPAPPKVTWRPLFNGKDLTGWKITEFGGEGDVDVEDGAINLGFGQYLTGVTYKGKDLPTNNYEIELEAMRVEGFDFFCGLTFPVGNRIAVWYVEDGEVP